MGLRLQYQRVSELLRGSERAFRILRGQRSRYRLAHTLASTGETRLDKTLLDLVERRDRALHLRWKQMPKQRQVVSDEVASGRQAADLAGAHALLKPGNEALGVPDGRTGHPPAAIPRPAASATAVEMERNAAPAQREREAQRRGPIVVQQCNVGRGGISHGTRPQPLQLPRDCTQGFCRSLSWNSYARPCWSCRRACTHRTRARAAARKPDVMRFTFFRRAASPCQIAMFQ